MKILRWLVLLLVLALMVITGALVGLRYEDSLRDQLLERVLAPYGVRGIRSQITDVSFGSIQFGLIEVDYSDPSVSLTLAIKELNLHKLANANNWFSLHSWSASAPYVQASLRQKLHDESDNELSLEPVDFLPESIIKLLPLGAMKADEMMVNYTPLDTEPWFFSGSIDADIQHIGSQYKLIQGNQHFVGDIMLTPKKVAITIGQEGEPTWVDVQSSLEFVDDNFVAGGIFSLTDLRNSEDWLALLPVKLPATDDWQGQLKGAFSMTLAKTTLQAWQSGNTQQMQGLNFQGQVTGDFGLNVMEPPSHRVDYNGSASIQVQDHKLTIKPLSSGNLRFNLATYSDPIQAIAKPLVGESRQLSVTAKGDFVLNADLIEKTTEMNFSSVQLKVGDSPTHLTSEVSLKGIRVLLGNGQLSAINGSAVFDLDLKNKPALKGMVDINAQQKNQDIEGNLQFKLQDLTQLDSDFTYHSKQKMIEFALTSERVNLAATAFNQWAEKLSLPVALELGDFAVQMQGKIDLNNKATVKADGSLLVENWQGEIEKNYFEALDSPLKFSGDLSQFVMTANVTNGLFDIGIPITNIQYQVTILGDTQANSYQVHIKNLQSRLMGGLIRIPEIIWDSQGQTTAFNVVIYDWRFKEIIKLIGRDDLKVSGKLDGMLPVTVTKQGVTITDGLLTARSPGGYIRFKPDKRLKASLSDQKELEVAMNVLDNFNYEKLDVVLNQTTDLNQYLNLTLRGKNPGVYEGTPVNLNLNIEHNIGPLIQTLTLPSAIEEHWDDLESIENMN